MEAHAPGVSIDAVRVLQVGLQQLVQLRNQTRPGQSAARLIPIRRATTRLTQQEHGRAIAAMPGTCNLKRLSHVRIRLHDAVRHYVRRRQVAASAASTCLLASAWLPLQPSMLVLWKAVESP